MRRLKTLTKSHDYSRLFCLEKRRLKRSLVVSVDEGAVGVCVDEGGGPGAAHPQVPGDLSAHQPGDRALQRGQSPLREQHPQTLPRDLHQRQSLRLSRPLLPQETNR